MVCHPLHRQRSLALVPAAGWQAGLHRQHPRRGPRPRQRARPAAPGGPTSERKMIMQFWHDNKIEGQWIGDPADLAKQFWQSKTVWPGRANDPNDPMSTDGALGREITVGEVEDYVAQAAAGLERERHPLYRIEVPPLNPGTQERAAAAGLMPRPAVAPKEIQLLGLDDEELARAVLDAAEAAHDHRAATPVRSGAATIAWIVPPAVAAQMTELAHDEVPVLIELDSSGQPVPAAEGPAFDWPEGDDATSLDAGTPGVTHPHRAGGEPPSDGEEAPGDNYIA